MKKIILSVTKEDDSSVYSLSEQNKSKIVKKYKSKCAACHINISDYHHIHVENSQFIPLCGLCYYPLHLDKIITKNPGSIILLPEIDQIQLNSILRAMEFVKLKKEDYEEVADAIDIIEVLLKERADMADTYYSSGVSNVNLVSQVLFSFSDDDYKVRETGLFGLRLMHNMDNFEKEMKFWELELAKYKPEKWKDFIKKVAESQK